MRWRVEVSAEAQKNLSRLPRQAQERLVRAIDELAQKDDSQWSNVKALQGPNWKGRLRRKVGPFRIIFRKVPDRATVEISAVLIRSEDTYR